MIPCWKGGGGGPGGFGKVHRWLGEGRPEVLVWSGGAGATSSLIFPCTSYPSTPHQSTAASCGFWHPVKGTGGEKAIGICHSHWPDLLWAVGW